MNRSTPLSLSFLSRLGPALSICGGSIAIAAFVMGMLSGVAAPAWAQSASVLRPFPPSTQRGSLVVLQHPQVTVNGNFERLSPGARIHGIDNRIVLSSALQGQKLLVNFVREPHGLVHEVWILTTAEAATPLP